MSLAVELQLIAICVGIACSLCGTFLVVRGQAMICDAISHTILLGIVLAFLMTHDLNSPLLLLGATFMGVATVWLTETVANTGLMPHDSAIGLVFPFLFAIAIILISKYTGSVHLDTDAVLLGELTFAPFDRYSFNGVDLGPKSLYSSSLVLLFNLICTTLFYKELQISTFDPLLASTLDFSPVLLHYGLMSMVSLTAVSAFQSVGSILVLAFMVGPSATAFLLTQRLSSILVLATFFSTLSCVLGFQLALYFDVSIPGMIAVVIGAIFGLTLLLTTVKGFSQS